MVSNERCKALANAITRATRVAISDHNRKDIRTALAAVDEFIVETKGPDNKHLYSARKKLVPLRNTLSGTLDADTNRSLSSTLTKYEDNIRTYVKEFIEECRTGVAKKSTSAKGLTRVQGKSPMIPKTPEEAQKEMNDDAIKERDLALLIKHQVLVNRLPKEIDDGFVMSKSSVLPTFNKVIFSLDKYLTQVGIKFDRIDVYHMLEDQVLIAFDSHTPDKDDFIKESLDIINEASNTQYILVSDVYVRHPLPGYDVVFAWIMDKKKFQKLTMLAGSFSVKFWSFLLQNSKKKK